MRQVWKFIRPAGQLDTNRSRKSTQGVGISLFGGGSRAMHIRLVLLILAVLIASGCSRVTKTYVPEPVFVNSDTPDYVTENEEIDLSKLSYDDYKDATDLSILIAEMIALSDRKCTWHKATIMANSNVWNIGTGSAAILFAGAAAVVSHAGTAAELAAAATVIAGIRSLANQEIYGDALVVTILTAIDIRREKQRVAIELRIADGKYSLAAAIADIQRYHSSCSLMQGVVEVTEALATRKKSRAEVQRDIDHLKTQIGEADDDLTQSSTEDKAKYVSDLTSQLARSQLALLDASE